MTEAQEHKKPAVNWGTLGKNILAGAAIVAGALIVFPGLGAGLLAVLGTAGTTLGAATAGVGASSAGAGIGVLLTKALGVALAYVGAQHFMSKDDHQVAGPSAADQQESDRSFAAREDIRKMQALMMARMQAQGYEPAMAMAAQQGRQ